MADTSVFNLSRNRPAIFESFEKGRQMRQERNINQQAMQENEIKLENLQSGQQEVQDEARLNAIVNSALILQGTPESAWLDTIDNRISAFADAGLPDDDLVELKTQIQSGDMEGARESVEQAASLKGRLDGVGVQGRTPTMLKKTDPETGEEINVPGVIITDALRS